MNPIEFLFTLLSQYVPINPGKYELLKTQALEWYVSKPEEENRIAYWIRKNGEVWWVQIGLAVLFIFMVRWIHDFMNPKRDDEGKV